MGQNKTNFKKNSISAAAPYWDPSLIGEQYPRTNTTGLTMQLPTELTFIDHLVTKRNKLISTYSNAIRLSQEALAICTDIDKQIPVSPEAHIDTMSNVFWALRTELGEDARRLPKFADSRSNDKLLDMITAQTDGMLWSMLFNRLNVYALMNTKTRKNFAETCKSAPLEFTAENVLATLMDIYQRADEYLITGLLDAVIQSDTSYKSNSRRSFQRRTIFEDAVTLVNGSYFRLQSHGTFRDVLRFLSRIVFADRPKSGTGSHDGQVLESDYLSSLISPQLVGYEQKDVGSVTVQLDELEIRFFQKGTAHLIMSQELVNFLNIKLSGVMLPAV